MSSSQSINQSLDQTNNTVSSNPGNQSTQAPISPEDRGLPGIWARFHAHGGFRTSKDPPKNSQPTLSNDSDLQRMDRIDAAYREQSALMNPLESSTRTQTTTNDIINPNEVVSSSQSINQSLDQNSQSSTNQS